MRTIATVLVLGGLAAPSLAGDAPSNTSFDVPPRGVYEVAIDGAADCPLDPPCNGIDEGEPCDDAAPDITNGGCNSTPEVFGAITLDGPPVCGTVWGDNGTADTDWLGFHIDETTPVEMELRSEMVCVAWLAEMSPGGACPVVGIPDGLPAYGGGCGFYHQVGVRYVLEPGDYVVYITTGCTTCDPGPMNNYPCSAGFRGDGHRYEIALRTAAPPPPPCPWDLDGSGDVGFADILEVIGNWGPCTGCPQDINDNGDVDFADILQVISNWGPCPAP